MKLKFNRMERIAGTFIALAILGTLTTGAAILVRKGFFDRKLSFHTVMPSSDSVSAGMPVQMAGVRIGSVDSIDLDASGKAVVIFSVKARYADRVRADSEVSFARHSFIGERIFDLSSGSPEASAAKPGQLIALRSSSDVMNLLTGARASQILENVDHLVLELTEVAKQISDRRNMAAVMANLRTTTDTLREILPQIKQTASRFPAISEDLGKVAGQLAVVTEQLARTSPEGKTKVTALIEETNLLIRALQRNFLVKGAVQDLREDDAKAQAKSEPQRLPASEAPASP